MDFFNAYAQGFARVAACTLPIKLVSPRANAEAVLARARDAADQGACLAVFPELTLTGYSIDDLLMQDTVLAATLDALDWLVPATADLGCIVVVGAPLVSLNRIYNCAVVILRGQVLGVVPKSYLPTYREFYERRQVAPGDDVTGEIRIAGQDVPFGSDLLFAADDVDGFVLNVEICEDMWVPIPPSAEAALAGATVIANLSGSPITVAKAEERKLLIASGSSRLLAGYVFAAAGEGESSTDLSWDGQTLVYEAGTLLAESERFPSGPRTSIADVDLGSLVQDRLRQGTFDDNRRVHAERTSDYRTVSFTLDPPSGDLGLRRRVARFPFVPDDPARLAQDCYEAYSIQVSGLEQRLREIGQPKIVIGVSGGLDSTHALIVAARAMDRMGRPRSDILAFTMPGFATSDHTKGNATALATALGVTFAELDITETARLMLDNIDHPFSEGKDVYYSLRSARPSSPSDEASQARLAARASSVYDVTFENVQAGLRTDYLFRLANARGGIVLGTGDLSELALGWCTYGVGDQMSHYNVNAGVPKTLIQHLIRWVISEGLFTEAVGETLQAVLDTEISPELVPVNAGEIPQSTQAVIGPYALQDFSLYQVLRKGMRPSRIAFLAWHAWHDADAGAWPEGFPADERVAYDLATIKKWLGVFCSRFFGFAQFKRSALPNGPKVVRGGSLSPRGDWRAPSDTSAALWLAELENVPEN
jgi:NAD+ synthase (glutamine-hydrolysing)